jgi:hypothetical protein
MMRKRDQGNHYEPEPARSTQQRTVEKRAPRVRAAERAPSTTAKGRAKMPEDAAPRAPLDLDGPESETFARGEPPPAPPKPKLNLQRCG